MHESRRQFLKRTVAATAACGLAQLSAANGRRSQPISDTHVYLGHWPHRQLPGEDLASLVAELRRNEISQAWVGSFDGLFHKDLAGVNQRLAETCKRVDEGMLIPFGTINPTLPEWEDDVRRCHVAHHMPGVRLHPSYHGYTLEDPRFARLLGLAAVRGLIVQLVTWMEAERHLLLNPREPEVDVRPLTKKIAPLPRLRIILANYYHTSQDESMRTLLKNEQIYVDFARASDPKEIKQLIDQLPERVILGSCAPLHYAKDPMSKLNGLRLTSDIHLKIARANATALLTAARKTSGIIE